MKMDRLIGILSLLLQRDVESLRRAGIPIATTQGAGGDISILEGYRVDRTVRYGSRYAIRRCARRNSARLSPRG